MYVKQLDIANIRSYREATLEFSPNINIIVGPNNSGKSTILKCLQKLQNQQGSIDSSDIRKMHESGKAYVQIDDISAQEHKMFYNENSQNHFTCTGALGVLFGFYNLPSKNNREERYVIDDRYWTVVKEDTDISVRNKVEPNVKFDTFGGFPLMENENNFIYLFLSKRKSQHYSGGNGKISTYSVDEDLRNLPSKIKKLSNSSYSFYKEYNDYCEKILGFPIGSMSGTSNQTEDRIGIFVKQDPIFLESMGEGVANILGLLSILLSEDKKLFLIEEIENDIHPEALKKLLNLILEKSRENQFIISTHSNIVLKHLASASNTKIFYIDWKLLPSETNEKIKIPTSSVTEVQNNTLNRLEILEKLGYDLFDFDLYKSYIVFEESSAEQIVRDYLIPWFVSDMDTKVKTIGAKGADNIEAYFDDFLRLFVYLNANSVYRNKAWVIADGDDAGKRNIEKLRAKFTNWPREHFITLSKGNFEEYYPKHFKDDFAEVDQIVDKRKRFEAKTLLTKKIIEWIRANPETARCEFEISAKEVIDILKTISTTISGSKSPFMD